MVFDLFMEGVVHIYFDELGDKDVLSSAAFRSLSY